MSADRQALIDALDGSLEEMDQLAELWLELRAARRDTDQVARAIDQASRESRRYERKLRRMMADAIKLGVEL